MARIWEDRVLEVTTTTGTGALALGGAVTGFKTFSSVMTTNDVCFYMIEAIDGSGLPTGDWESGHGTYSGANTLTRTKVIRSSNADAAVSFSAGVKRVSISLVAATMQVKDGSVSAVSSFDIEEFAGLGARVVMIDLDLRMSTDSVGLTLQFKLNGSYKSAASHRWTMRQGSSSGSTNLDSSAAGTFIGLSGPSGTWGIGNASLESYAGQVIIMNADSANVKQVNILASYGAPSGQNIQASGSGHYEGTDYASVLEGCRIAVSSGTVTGTYKVTIR